jgi:hypothetical protein
MKNDIALVYDFRRHRVVVDAINRVMKSRVFFEMTNIIKAARGEIVDDEYFIAALEVRVREM